jgi:hypothetical protein
MFDGYVHFKKPFVRPRGNTAGPRAAPATLKAAEAKHAPLNRQARCGGAVLFKKLKAENPTHVRTNHPPEPVVADPAVAPAKSENGVEASVTAMAHQTRKALKNITHARTALG